MGRRAKKAPVQTKKRPTLAKRFKCPFCANDQVVECKMDFRAGIGSLECRLCGASYQMPIHHLHEPVDVFSEWLDDCQAAEQQQQGGGAAEPAVNQYDEEEEDEDDDLGEPSVFARQTEAAAPSGTAASPKEKQSTEKPSYSALGLDDSDDDDED